MRALAFTVASALFVAGVVLGYIAVVALRRGEGVFLPTGYVSVACLGTSVWLIRFALHG